MNAYNVISPDVFGGISFLKGRKTLDLRAVKPSTHICGYLIHYTKMAAVHFCIPPFSEMGERMPVRTF